MIIEQNRKADKISEIKDMKKVSLARFQVNFGVLLIIDERRIRDRFQPTGGFYILPGLISVQQGWHLLVIPVGHGKNDFPVYFVGIRGVFIVNDDGTSESIWELAQIMLRSHHKKQLPERWMK